MNSNIIIYKSLVISLKKTSLIRVNDTIALLWAKSNSRSCDQFECDVTFLLLLLFDFVHSDVRCGCCSIICLRFEVMKKKQFDCKMSTKKTLFFKKKTFRDILGQLHTQEYNATKK